MDFEKIWSDLQESIMQAVGTEVSYMVHIKPAQAVSFKDSVFTISVPNSINKNMIDFRFKNKIEGILQSNGMMTRKANFRQEQVFNACLPLMQNQNDIKELPATIQSMVSETIQAFSKKDEQIG